MPSDTPLTAVTTRARARGRALTAPLTAILTTTLAAALGLTGCSLDAKTAKPESKRFAYAGRSLKLLTHEVATKLVATDRKDIKVTRWFDTAAGTVHLKWTLKGDTLDIEAGCSGLALCDARFMVEVPKGISVTKNGHRVLRAHPAASPSSTAPAAHKKR
ncbi:hypothetical protein [Streptomyces sp. NPDC059649]|uniref:hypothetical protein n=1 Tax=Streptomyces sp. NPDC059649 TaxID=3346895 RepID=UPI0036996A69